MAQIIMVYPTGVPIIRECMADGTARRLAINLGVASAWRVIDNRQDLVQIYPLPQNALANTESKDLK